MNDSEMTIRIYTINPATGERTEIPAATKEPTARNPYDKDRWPPCTCQRCRAQRRQV